MPGALESSLLCLAVVMDRKSCTNASHSGPKEFLSPYVKRHPLDSWVPSLHVLSEVHECDTVPYKTNQFFVRSARDNTSNV